MSTSTASASRFQFASLVRPAAIAAAIASVINLVLFFVLPGLFNTTLQIPMGAPGSNAPLMDLPFFMVIAASSAPAFAAAGLLSALPRFTAQPLRIFQIIAVATLLFSVFPLVAFGMPGATAVILGLMHTVAAGAIVGVFTRELA